MNRSRSPFRSTASSVAGSWWPADAESSKIEEIAREDPKIAPLLEGKTIRKVVVVPGKLLNFVVG